MRKILALLPLLAIVIMCSNSTPVQRSVQQVNLSIKGLRKAYLDTAETGVILEMLFYDPWLKERDSVKFYSVELDEDFTTKGELKRMYLVPYADTLLRKVIKISTDRSQLPGSFLYEVGAIYMSPPQDENSLEWELDTVINQYFTFRVYGDQKEYQQFVDSFGLEPTVFVYE